MRVRLQYSPEVGRVVPDGMIEEWWNKKAVDAKQYNVFDQVGSSAMITRARLGLVRGEISCLVISFNGTAYECNEYGALPDELTELMQSYVHQWSMEILKTGLEIMKGDIGA